jgi:molybdate transport system substrate-binding protein
LKRIAGLLGAALIAGPMLAGCSASADAPLTVYAAASLRDVMTKLQEAYGPMTMSLGGSSTLRVQIEQGAPADLFLSADAAQVDQLAASGHVDGEPVTFARNSVVLVVPRKGSRVHNWKDLTKPGVQIVAADEAVPIQAYADELVEQLAALPQAPPGFAAGVQSRIASREDNVAAILARVQLGEGDAGFVYATDAKGASVRALPLPVGVEADYVGAAVRGPHAAEARRFLDWLGGTQAQAILRDHGFGTP